MRVGANQSFTVFTAVALHGFKPEQAPCAGGAVQSAGYHNIIYLFNFLFFFKILYVNAHDFPSNALVCNGSVKVSVKHVK